MSALSTIRVLDAILDERTRQDARWGEQNHPDGTGGPERSLVADVARAKCERHARHGSVTWADILAEEVAEALAEDMIDKLRAELIQVAAVATTWVEAIDRRRRP